MPASAVVPVAAMRGFWMARNRREVGSPSADGRKDEDVCGEQQLWWTRRKLLAGLLARTRPRGRVLFQGVRTKFPQVRRSFSTEPHGEHPRRSTHAIDTCVERSASRAARAERVTNLGIERNGHRRNGDCRRFGALRGLDHVALFGQWGMLSYGNGKRVELDVEFNEHFSDSA